MSVPEKLCVFCDHFGWNSYSITDYGGDTGACVDSGGMSCAKGQLPKLYDPENEHARGDDDVAPYDVVEFRMAIMCAAQCPDYSPPNVPLPLLHLGMDMGAALDVLHRAAVRMGVQRLDYNDPTKDGWYSYALVMCKVLDLPAPKAMEDHLTEVLNRIIQAVNARTCRE